jgi:hypothetical protein
MMLISIGSKKKHFDVKVVMFRYDKKFSSLRTDSDYGQIFEILKQARWD